MKLGEMNREQAMRLVQMYDFALVDTGLFLDTHPNCKEALIFFDETRKKSEEARNYYEKNFGPLTCRNVDVTKDYQWAMTKWPWELED